MRALVDDVDVRPDEHGTTVHLQRTLGLRPAAS
jgi:hypothetical protein